MEGHESRTDEQAEYRFISEQQREGEKAKKKTVDNREANEVRMSPFPSSWKGMMAC